MGGEKEEKIDDYNRILIFFFLFSETVHGLCLKFCLKEENKTRPFRLPSTCSFSQACGGDEEKTTPSARQTLIFLSLVWPVLRCLSLHREVMSVLSWRSYSFLLKSARKGRKRQEEPPQHSSFLFRSCGQVPRLFLLFLGHQAQEKEGKEETIDGWIPDAQDRSLFSIETWAQESYPSCVSSFHPLSTTRLEGLFFRLKDRKEKGDVWLRQWMHVSLTWAQISTEI